MRSGCGECLCLMSWNMEFSSTTSAFAASTSYISYRRHIHEVRHLLRVYCPKCKLIHLSLNRRCYFSCVPAVQTGQCRRLSIFCAVVSCAAIVLSGNIAWHSRAYCIFAVHSNMDRALGRPPVVTRSQRDLDLLHRTSALDRGPGYL